MKKVNGCEYCWEQDFPGCENCKPKVNETEKLIDLASYFDTNFDFGDKKGQYFKLFDMVRLGEVNQEQFAKLAAFIFNWDYKYIL